MALPQTQTPVLDVPAINQKRLPVAENREHLPQLDGVRGIAILLVLVWHYVASKADPQSGPLAGFLSGSLAITWSGVDLFFVLSGFLIGGILIDNREAPHYFRTFYVRRICRIFPLYFAWLLVFVLVNLVATALISTGPLDQLVRGPIPLWSYATFTQNIAMALAGTHGAIWLADTWSLAVEEQFYLILPPLIRLVSPRKLPYVLISMIVAAPILRVLVMYLPPHSEFANYVLMPTRADSLLAGVLVAYIIRQRKMVQGLYRRIKAIYVLFVILLIGAGILTVFSRSLPGPSMISIGYFWLAILYACFILIGMIKRDGIVARVTRVAWLGNLGIIAYGVYLLHEAFNNLSHALVLGQMPQLHTGLDLLVSLGSLCVTILVARVSFKYFERRITAIGHRSTYFDTAPIVQGQKALSL